MTTEGRQSVVKTVRSLGEQAKQSIQNTRKQCNTTLRAYAKGAVSEDEVRDLERQMKALVANTTARVDVLVAEKSEEMMAVATKK